MLRELGIFERAPWVINQHALFDALAGKIIAENRSILEIASRGPV